MGDPEYTPSGTNTQNEYYTKADNNKSNTSSVRVTQGYRVTTMNNMRGNAASTTSTDHKYYKGEIEIFGAVLTLI